LVIFAGFKAQTGVHGLDTCPGALDGRSQRGIDGVGTTMIFTLPRDPVGVDGEVSSYQPGEHPSEGDLPADDPQASRLREQLSAGS
jgi:hypothetical protein